MAAQTLTTEAFVLERRPSASDGWESFILFSGDHGCLPALKRRPGKNAADGMLDLFDEASVTLESSNQGRSWFIREARLIKRRLEIGKSYGALSAASALARVIARNASGPESSRPILELLRAAFAALIESDRPDIVLFKSLYRFARDEGYPVKQDWLANLPDADRTAALTLLTRPLEGQGTPAAAVERLQRLFHEYLKGSTDLLLE